MSNYDDEFQQPRDAADSVAAQDDGADDGFNPFGNGPAPIGPRSPDRGSHWHPGL